MPEKSIVWYFPILILMVYLTAACTNQPAELPEQGITPRDRTGVAELDNVITIVMGGRRDELQSILGFTQTECTFAEGLGGPPKCLEGEAEGTPVDVLPFLGPEGHFFRKEDIDTWEGLNLSELFAAYQVSDSAYSDENYPAGDYALVFIDADAKDASITLQVKDGKIVRIDYRFGNPPAITPEDVEKYLVMPPYLVP